MRLSDRRRDIRMEGGLIVPAAVLLLLVTGCGRDQPAEGDQPAASAKPVPVRAARAETMTLHPSIDLVGTLAAIPERTAMISPQTTGRIRKVAVLEGDTVQADHELILIDSRIAEAKLRKAQALLEEKQANLERLKNGPLAAEIEIARQEVQKTSSQVETQRSKVSALSELRKRDEVSTVKLDEARSALEVAKADHAKARENLKLLESGTRPETIAEAAAQVATARADVDAAQLDVEFCRITSPIDGVIDRLPARQGMTVDPSTDLATVVDLSELFVSFRVPGAWLTEVGPGSRVDAHVGSLSDRLFHGNVTRLSSQANPDTGDVGAFATLANEGRMLRPGLACRVRVWLPEVTDAVAVPIAAVADREGTPVVTVIRDDKAYETEVVLGVETSAYAQVLAGVAAGDLVAVEGGYGLPDGCPVRLLPAAATTQP